MTRKPEVAALIVGNRELAELFGSLPDDVLCGDLKMTIARHAGRLELSAEWISFLEQYNALLPPSNSEHVAEARKQISLVLRLAVVKMHNGSRVADMTGTTIGQVREYVCRPGVSLGDDLHPIALALFTSSSPP